MLLSCFKSPKAQVGRFSRSSNLTRVSNCLVVVPATFIHHGLRGCESVPHYYRRRPRQQQRHCCSWLSLGGPNIRAGGEPLPARSLLNSRQKQGILIGNEPSFWRPYFVPPLKMISPKATHRTEHVRHPEHTSNFHRRRRPPIEHHHSYRGQHVVGHHVLGSRASARDPIAAWPPATARQTTGPLEEPRCERSHVGLALL